MRKIIHIDMDCFYAAVEMRDNPAYREIPIAVGGNSARGVLCTCNYLAREYGVRSAMPNHKAKQLCPDLLIVNGRMAVYQQVSKHIHAIFKRYTSLIEPLSLDEAYLDVSDCQLFHGSATLIAEQIRADIFNETGLTASAGVAPNKFLAKIASDENKPNGQCVIAPDQVAGFVADLSLRKIPGVGPKTAEKLAEHGFTSCRDVRQSSIVKLRTLVGKQAASLFDRSFGRDERQVVTTRERKSLAVETTLAHNIVQLEQVIAVADSLFDKLTTRFQACSDRVIVKQGVKLKFADFNQTTVEQQSDEINLVLFKDLLTKAMLRANDREIRLVGLTLGFQSQKTQLQETGQLALPIG